MCVGCFFFVCLFVLFCFVLFCFVLFCFVLLCFVLCVFFFFFFFLGGGGVVSEEQTHTLVQTCWSLLHFEYCIYVRERCLGHLDQHCQAVGQISNIRVKEHVPKNSTTSFISQTFRRNRN